MQQGWLLQLHASQGHQQRPAQAPLWEVQAIRVSSRATLMQPPHSMLHHHSMLLALALYINSGCAGLPAGTCGAGCPLSCSARPSSSCKLVLQQQAAAELLGAHGSRQRYHTATHSMQPCWHTSWPSVSLRLHAPTCLPHTSSCMPCEHSKLPHHPNTHGHQSTSASHTPPPTPQAQRAHL
jgi:hypothetical protein